MQPGLFAGLLVLVISWVVVERLTRVELAKGYPGPFNRHQTFGALLLLAAMLLLVLCRQWKAWGELKSTGLPIPPGATHLVGWPPTASEGRTWVIRYHGTLENARRFYEEVAPRNGFTVNDVTGVSFLLDQGEAAVVVGVHAGLRDTTLVLHVTPRR